MHPFCLSFFRLQAHGAHMELVTAKVEKSLLQDCTANLVRGIPAAHSRVMVGRRDILQHSLCMVANFCPPAPCPSLPPTALSRPAHPAPPCPALPRPLSLPPPCPARSPSCMGCTWWTPPGPWTRLSACCAPTASWQRPGTTGGRGGTGFTLQVCLPAWYQGVWKVWHLHTGLAP